MAKTKSLQAGDIAKLIADPSIGEPYVWYHLHKELGGLYREKNLSPNLVERIESSPKVPPWSSLQGKGRVVLILSGKEIYDAREGGDMDSDEIDTTWVLLELLDQTGFVIASRSSCRKIESDPDGNY